MKTFKKLTSVLLAVIMFMAMGVTAFAADGDLTYTITITHPTTSAATHNHTYDAYQVFSGTLSGSTLSNIEWGTGVNGAELLAALKIADPTTYGTCTTAADVADKLTEDNAADFADVAALHLTAVKKSSAETASNAEATISGLAAGYYLIQDADGSPTSAAAKTSYILEVAGNVTVEAKVDIPSLDKVIVEGTQEVDANTASIDETITYKLTVEVPNMTGYDHYYVIVDDTMATGITFNNITSVKHKGTTLVDGTEYRVSINGQNLKVTIKDLLALHAEQGDKIVIEYTAKLNENADLTTDPVNTNTAKLTYTNDPNYKYGYKHNPDGSVVTDGDGNPEERDDPQWPNDDGKGTYTPPVDLEHPYDPENPPANQYDPTPVGPNDDTTPVTVVTYTTSIRLNKLDENLSALSGATFKIESADAEIPTAYTADELAVDATGHLLFKGLGAGTYKITEVNAPSGYNKLTTPITVVISADPTTSGCTWTVKVNGFTKTADNNVYDFNVQNNKGANLPATGGIGTTMFYAAGAVLMAVAGVLLITKKRMNSKAK